jgi:hypothetical protein
VCLVTGSTACSMNKQTTSATARSAGICEQSVVHTHVLDLVNEPTDIALAQQSLHKPLAVEMLELVNVLT